MKRKDFTSRSKTGYGPRHIRSISPAEPGFRSRRLVAGRHGKRRQLTKMILVTGAIAAVVVFAGVLLMVRTRGSGAEGGALPAAADGSGNIIMVGRDDAGKLIQLMVLTGEAEGGFSMYSIPVRTIADIPGQGFRQLNQVYDGAGQPALDQAVADLLQIPIQYHVLFSYPAVELLAAQPGSLNLKTDRSLMMNSGPGNGGAVTIPVGDNPMDAAAAVAVLQAAVEDNRDGPRVQAVFYQGLRDALTTRSERDRQALARQLIQRVETDMDEDYFLDQFVAATTPGRAFVSRSLPVKVMGAGGAWYFEPLIGDVQQLIAGSPQDAAYQLQIQNGTEVQGLVEAAAAKLEPLRYSTELKTDPSGVSFDFTQIRCGSDALAAGNRVRDMLGSGTIIKDESLEKKQIIVIIGNDLNLALGGQM
ncbi:MAG: LytR C-terminal domain-containing protein [Thermoleophilia bacterium]